MKLKTKEKKDMLKLSKKQAEMIKAVETEAGLEDGCKYMVYLKNGFEHYDMGACFPVRNQKELNEFMKDVDNVQPVKVSQFKNFQMVLIIIDKKDGSKVSKRLSTKQSDDELKQRFNDDEVLNITIYRDLNIK
jgi:hypothetical protein